MRIDAHVHFTPPMTPVELEEFCRQEPYWGLLLKPPPGGRSLQGWATAERMIQDMDAAGIDKVVMQGEYRLTHQAAVERNNRALEVMGRWPERAIVFAMLQPTAGQKALDELRRCLDAGMRGVGELNPYGQGHRIDHPDFLRLAEACIEHDIPLNLHVSEEIGRYYLGKSTTPLRHYYWLACRYPELKLILAHWGGGLLFYELMPKVRHELRNVWYDTAASPLLYPTAGIFRTALQCVDHRKILFGSDYPLLLYPGRQHEPDFRPFLAQVHELDAAPDVRQDIMGDNMARLLGLPGVPPISGTAQLERGLDRDKAHRREADGSGPPDVIVDAPPEGTTDARISGFMAVSMVAEHWPQTQPVFERFNIPWKDSPLPFWEPIIQAAAAQGWGPLDQQRLLDELNQAIQ
jgi:predicted TIM-barrel fold metal-dependent hydrolase